MAGMADTRCWKCGHEHDRPLRELQRSDACRACGSALHACRICLSYAPQLHRKCRNDRADPPRDVETANFCDWYEPSADAWQRGADDAAAQARAALDALFRK